MQNRTKPPQMPDCTFIACFMAALSALAPSLPMSMQKGVASTYTEGHSRTACGDRYSRSALAAAHRTLPCGTTIRVWRGDRHIDVRINDRGPFVKGRIIDLTPAGARALGFDGVADVMLERLD
jgi:rare lipoprotein A